MSKHRRHHHHHKKIEECTGECPIEKILEHHTKNEPKPQHIHKEDIHFTTEEALLIATRLGIDFESCDYDIDEFRKGLDVELEHGRVNRHTNVTNNDPILTGKIALAHLNEFPDYYVRLAKMEEEARHYWKKRRERE